MRESVRQLFQKTQCSWCESFYTTALFLCPNRKLQSSCPDIRQLSSEKRATLLKEEKWLRHAEEMFRQVQKRGIMARCRNEDCLSLNPNPQTITCWRCGQDALTCPSCHKPALNYDIESDLWICINSACGYQLAGKSETYLSHAQDNQPAYSTDKEVVKERLRARRNTIRLIIVITIMIVAIFILIMWAMLGGQITRLF